MKNTQKILIATVLGLSFSLLALGQVSFVPKKILTTNPNSLTAINNTSQVMANQGTLASDEISLWNRFVGFEGIGLNVANSGGVAIDSASDIVGAGNPDGSGIPQAFLWRSGTGVEWLGSLGGKLSEANGMNDDGAVVGLSYTSSYMQHAFLWTQSGGMQDLTPDVTSIGGAAATGINATNEVVGYYFPNGTRLPIGFSWTQAGGLENIGPAGTLALAVNDSGMVVGQSPNAQGFKHAFSYTTGGGMKDLGTLGGTASSALAVNNLGWVVGTSLTSGKTGLLHAFLWTPSGGMQDFTGLAGLGSSQQPYSIQVNDFGVVALSTNKGLFVLTPKMAVTLTPSANPSKVGQSVTFTAKITSIAGPPPDGEALQFLASGVVIGTATVKNGVASVTTSALTAGSHPMQVNYAGDDNYLADKYRLFTQVVNP